MHTTMFYDKRLTFASECRDTLSSVLTHTGGARIFAVWGQRVWGQSQGHKGAAIVLGI